MIQANELRTGNYVKYRWATIKVRSIDLDGINLKHDYNKYACQDQIIARIRFRNELLHPIPLTDEILLKCGFTNTGGYISFYNGDFGLIWNEDHISLQVEGQWLTLKVKSLHQLQNLYHALTGQELNIEL